MANSIGDAFGCLVGMVVTLVIIVIIFTGYLIYDETSENIIESREIIKPDYRLEASGKKIDTIYIYKFKKR